MLKRVQNDESVLIVLLVKVLGNRLVLKITAQKSLLYSQKKTHCHSELVSGSERTILREQHIT
jgi:hypothetical protein